MKKIISFAAVVVCCVVFGGVLTGCVKSEEVQGDASREKIASSGNGESGAGNSEDNKDTKSRLQELVDKFSKISLESGGLGEDFELEERSVAITELQKLCGDDAKLIKSITQYTDMISNAHSIENERGFEEIFNLRDTVIIPQLRALFKSIDRKTLKEISDYRTYDYIGGDLRQLGIGYKYHMYRTTPFEDPDMYDIPFLFEEIKARASAQYSLKHFSENLKHTKELFGTNKDLIEALDLYVNVISKSHYLNEFEDIQSLISIRDEHIIPEMRKIFFNRVMDELGESVLTSQLEYEFDMLGIGFLFAEGMAVDIASRADFMKEKLDNLATPDYKLYLNIKDNYNNANQGEYMLTHVKSRLKILLVFEEMRNSYPDSKYIEMIEPVYKWALISLADIHNIGDGEEEAPMLVAGSVHNKTYPYAADYPTQLETPYSDVFKRIYKNTSYILDSELIEAEEDNVYALIVKWGDTEEEAIDAVYDFLKKGIDVPHFFFVKDKKKYAVVYRFYGKEEKAQAEFDLIKNKFPVIVLEKLARDNIEGGGDYISWSNSLK